MQGTLRKSLAVSSPPGSHLDLIMLHLNLASGGAGTAVNCYPFCKCIEIKGVYYLNNGAKCLTFGE